jgi:hypothetical protein
MTSFELMRSELGCYLKDDLSESIDKEITTGLKGVSLGEFAEKIASVPNETKSAYHKAVCGKIDVLFGASSGEKEKK